MPGSAEISVFSFFHQPLIAHPFTINYGQLVAIAATVFVSWLNYIGVRRAGDFQFLFTLLKIAIILGIVAIGFSYTGGSWANFGSEFTGADIQITFVLEAANASGLLKDYPVLTEYLARIHARPAYKRAIEKGGPFDLSFGRG